MQGDDVGRHQTEQHQRHGNDVETEEAVQGGVTHHVVATDQQSQIGANHRHSGKQVHDHLGAPVRHLSPGQQVTHEGFGHQAQEDGTTKQPHQLARLAVGAINQATEHVEINHHKKCRSASGVHVADQPTPGHIAHDVFDRGECQCCIWLVVHDQENARDNLDHEHKQGQRAEKVPEIEVFGRVVLAQMLFVELGCGEAVVHPVEQLVTHAGVGGDFFEFSHVDSCQAFLSSPMISRESDKYICGGTSRLSGAGLFLNTRPAMSKVEPWQGHKKPPAQSSGKEGCAPS